MKKRIRKRHKAKLRMAGDPILFTVCDAIKPHEQIGHIVRDMLDILSGSKNGVGLSANQAGYSKRIIMFRNDKTFSGYETLINPQIIKHSPRTTFQSEGCLSYPGQFSRIKRYTWIDVHSKHIGERRYEGFIARIIQHEIDHLDGICKVAK